MDNVTEANTDIVKASGRTVDDVKILHCWSNWPGRREIAADMVPMPDNSHPWTAKEQLATTE
ncbi:hypothetical protein PoMZ_13034 [Pyricularia oryzae]|uniref:Uncharacterized protein n=1 Tax=Pyricularia oryzae TaxID=318829 RepID=A0A4P7NU46_PYROR|nr:hypothetical protein PoMZ_13034 [Pyricularia oryzae]